MCGIAGIIHSTPNKYNFLMKKIVSSLSHSGPDSEGIEVCDGAIFGHSRLSIIDVENGYQPMFTRDKKTMIAFNGEIYGYKDIRSKLSHEFSTQSDTEVILAMYEKYGDSIFSKLPGMFSIALWDSKKKTLLLGRDRFGEKPLFYAIAKTGEIIFASELKAILTSKLLIPKLSRFAVASYLKNLYIPPDITIFENIHVVRPGHYVAFKNQKVQIEKYYHFPPMVEIDPDHAVDIFRERLRSSIEKQLISDVPVGAFLSGGIDSSTIVAVASKYTKNLKTFSFGYKGNKNELSYASEVAKMYKTDHYEFRSDNINIADMLYRMNSVFDEPFADSSNIATYLLSEFASKHVKVALSGDGADELLGGYSWWYSQLLDIGNTGSLMQYFLFRAFGYIFDERNFKNKANRIKFSRKYSSYMEAHKKNNQFFSDIEISEILDGVDLSLTENQIHYENNISGVLKSDLLSYLPGDILVKTDRASMSNSLEIRSPFLDKDFANFCISLPANFKIDNYQTKKILRLAFENMLPRSILKRDKQGFGAPVNEWFLQNNLLDLKNEILRRDHKMFSYLSYDGITKFKGKNNYQTWALIILGIWFEKWQI